MCKFDLGNYIKYWNNRSLLMGMNGIIFEYTNEYWFHADLIYKWLFCQAVTNVIL
jgi:hypothetical protein